MRDDFAKQLTERERIHSRDHYHNYRHNKLFENGEVDEVGGRESMRVRYNHGYDRKSFSENLNPLKGWLRTCVGKQWDKCYSELRKKFDARKVVNNHILEHLYQDIEVNTYVEDGKVFYNEARPWGSAQKSRPISLCRSDYYVCPKDGTVKITHKQPRRSVIKQREAEKLQAQLAVKRVIDDRNVLHFIDGVWYHFTLEPIPEREVVYEKPYGVTTFKTGYNFVGNQARREKTWDELNQQERERFGRKTLKGEAPLDLFTGDRVYLSGGHVYGRSGYQRGLSNLYHATKQTASHKLLKKAGIAK